MKQKGDIFTHACPDITQVECIHEMLQEHRQDKKCSNRRIVGECMITYEEINDDKHDFGTESFPIMKNECVPASTWEIMHFVTCDLPKNEFTWSQMLPK